MNQPLLLFPHSSTSDRFPWQRVRCVLTVVDDDGEQRVREAHVVVEREEEDLEPPLPTGVLVLLQQSNVTTENTSL